MAINITLGGASVVAKMIHYPTLQKSHYHTTKTPIKESKRDQNSYDGMRGKGETVFEKEALMN